MEVEKQPDKLVGKVEVKAELVKVEVKEEIVDRKVKKRKPEVMDLVEPEHAIAVAIEPPGDERTCKPWNTPAPTWSLASSSTSSPATAAKSRARLKVRGVPVPQPVADDSVDPPEEADGAVASPV